jgi:outer membrane protein assembly factor BamB
VRWKVPIPGKAWSSPVVWGEQVWVTNAPTDGKELYALAFDRHTGKALHHIKVFDVAKPAFCHPTNSYASSTPCIEEGRIYIHFGNAGTACLDTTTGKKLWERRDFPCDHWRGAASSPIVWRDRLFVHFDGYDLQYIVALDKNTGQTLWKKDRSFDYGNLDGDLKKAYATPSVLEVNGKAQLVSPAAFGTIAYDPLSGEEIWKVVHGGMNVAARPLYYHGRFILCTGDGGLRLLSVQAAGSGDVTRTHIEWKTAKSVPSRSSPILVGDHLYMVHESGIVSEVDPRTGASLRQERLAGKFWASPIFAEGRLYFCNEEGITYIVDVSQGWKVLAANALADGFMASPAVADKALILRTRSHLYCIEQKD